jgi:hypothetical protein
MNKLMVIAVCSVFTYGAAAQSGHMVTGGFHGGVGFVQPRISVGFGYYAPFYSPLGYYGFPYWGFPYAGYYPNGSAYYSPSKLQRKEGDIRSDYADRIYSVRQDSSLSSKQKRQTIRSLKKQRDMDIRDLVANYHKQPVKP